MLLAHCVFCVCSTDQTQILMCIQISGILDSTTHERFALSKSSEHLTRLSQLCHSWTCSVTCTTSLRENKDQRHVSDLSGEPGHPAAMVDNSEPGQVFSGDHPHHLVVVIAHKHVPLKEDMYQLMKLVNVFLPGPRL